MQDAFSIVRSEVKTPREPNLVSKKFDDELLQMALNDGLTEVAQYEDSVTGTLESCPEVTSQMTDDACLWAVRIVDTVYAPENCDFGKALNNKKIKHTNLTGGTPAYCGGELIWLGEREILVNGCSGRYGPRNVAEMKAAALAFSKAGYRVWSTGYDEGTGFCFKFGASLPEEVTSL